MDVLRIAQLSLGSAQRLGSLPRGVRAVWEQEQGTAVYSVAEEVFATYFCCGVPLFVRNEALP